MTDGLIRAHLAIEGAAKEVTIIGGRLLGVYFHEESTQNLVDVVGVLIV